MKTALAWVTTEPEPGAAWQFLETLVTYESYGSKSVITCPLVSEAQSSEKPKVGSCVPAVQDFHPEWRLVCLGAALGTQRKFWVGRQKQLEFKALAHFRKLCKRSTTLKVRVN